MHKNIIIILGGVLLIGIIVLGILYSIESNRALEAESELVVLNYENNNLDNFIGQQLDFMNTLDEQLTTLESELETLQGAMISLQGELDTAHTSIEDQNLISQSLSDELEKIKNPRHFESKSELVAWLAQDDTDIAFPNKSTVERCYILQVRALRDGYILPVWFADLNEDKYPEYLGNLAYIGSNIYYVWVNNDSTLLWAIVEPIESRPLLMD